MPHTRQQRALQLGPFDPDAGACIAPQRLEISLRKHLPLLVTKLPSANNRACILDARRETEREQHAHPIGLDQEPGSQRMPTLLALDELHRLDLCHGSLPSRRTASTVCRGSRSLAGSGLPSWIGRNSDWDPSEIV